MEASVDFGDVDLGSAVSVSLSAVAATPPASPAAPLPSRPNRRRRKKGTRVAAQGTEQQQAAGNVSSAPWDVSDEQDLADKRQELRDALHKKLNQQRMARSNRGALEAKDKTKTQEGDGSSSMQFPDLSGLDAAAMRTVAAKMGISPDQMPSRRKMERMLKGLSMTELMSRAAGAKTK